MLKIMEGYDSSDMVVTEEQINDKNPESVNVKIL